MDDSFASARTQLYELLNVPEPKPKQTGSTPSAQIPNASTDVAIGTQTTPASASGTP